MGQVDVANHDLKKKNSTSQLQKKKREILASFQSSEFHFDWQSGYSTEEGALHTVYALISPQVNVKRGLWLEHFGLVVAGACFSSSVYLLNCSL